LINPVFGARNGDIRIVERRDDGIDVGNIGKHRASESNSL
jgi:hypothetical protein